MSWEAKVGKIISLFTKQGMKYRGQVLSYEDGFLTIYDLKTGQEQIINRDNIDRAEVENGGAGR